ncbi:MAG: DUF4328 domain-containing protein, partial [Cyanobacteria bacterium]|nr:DUF4328 domain-containing protein [Cyanobacteriota bacterium]
ITPWVTTALTQPEITQRLIIGWDSAIITILRGLLILTVLSYLASFILWAALTHQTIRHFSKPESILKFNKFTCILCWFVPLGNLIFPMYLVEELWAQSALSEESETQLIGIWWQLIILSCLGFPFLGLLSGLLYLWALNTSHLSMLNSISFLQSPEYLMSLSILAYLGQLSAIVLTLKIVKLMNTRVSAFIQVQKQSSDISMENV